MHDGRFGSLESVLNFYQNGVQDSPTLDPLLKNGNALGISLNDDEKLVLIAFLGTLTDDEFITDKRFAEY
jgi:cytochrome c peroxidase